MATATQRNYAGSYLAKAQQYLASAEDNLTADRYTPATGDALHAGINARDAIVTALAGRTQKGKDHSTASRELRQALGKRADAALAERALRELLAAKGEVEYGAALVTAAKDVMPLVERWRCQGGSAVRG